MEIGPQPGQRSPSDASHSLQTLQQDGVVYDIEGRWEIQENKQTADLSIQTSVDVILDPQQHRLCAVPRSVGWLHGVMDAVSWQVRGQLSGNDLLDHLARNGRFEMGQKFLRLLTHRPGFFKIGVITAILRQAGATDNPKDSLTTHSMCGRTQSSTADSFSRWVGAGSSMHDTLAKPWTSLRRSADVTVEKPSRVGTAAGSGSSSRGSSCCYMSSMSGADSSHLAVEELHKAVGQLLFAVMGWQRLGGCAGQEVVDDPVCIALHCQGDGGRK